MLRPGPYIAQGPSPAFALLRGTSAMQKMPAAIEIERTLKNAFRSIAAGPERDAAGRRVPVAGCRFAVRDLLSTAQTAGLRTGTLPQFRCICRRTANARAKPAGLDDAEQIKLQIKSNSGRRPRVTYSRAPET